MIRKFEVLELTKNRKLLKKIYPIFDLRGLDKKAHNIHRTLLIYLESNCVAAQTTDSKHQKHYAKMTSTSTIPDESPLAAFMKDLIDSKKFECTQIVTDNPKRLSLTSPILREHDKQKERWELCEKHESEIINCPQRRASIDDDELFSDKDFSDCCSDDDGDLDDDVEDDDDMNSHTSSTPLPSSPLSPSIGGSDKRIENTSDASALPYQMALRMVQQKYAATSITSPAQSPAQQPKKRVQGMLSAYRR